MEAQQLSKATGCIISCMIAARIQHAVFVELMSTAALQLVLQQHSTFANTHTSRSFDVFFYNTIVACV